MSEITMPCGGTAHLGECTATHRIPEVGPNHWRGGNVEVRMDHTFRQFRVALEDWHGFAKHGLVTGWRNSVPLAIKLRRLVDSSDLMLEVYSVDATRGPNYIEAIDG